MKNHAQIDAYLKAATSEDAATFVMNNFPIHTSNYSDAFNILRNRSWRRPDQIRLARFYLQKMPFASPKPYEVLSSFMALPLLINILRELLPSQSNDRQLVAYFLIPTLRKNIRSQRDLNAVDALSKELTGSCICQ